MESGKENVNIIHINIYRVSQNVCAPLKVQIERKLMNKNDLSTIGPR